LPHRAQLAFSLGLSYLGFLSLGLPDGLLGTAWPSIRASFALPLNALGPLLMVSTACYVAASFAAGWVLARASVGVLLAASCAATAASVIGYALAPAWVVIVSFGALAGFGAGCIDAGLNAYAAVHHSARTVSWLHACYALGAAAGPVLMTTVLAAGHPWQRGYAIVGLGQILLGTAFFLTRAHWPPLYVKPAESSTGDVLRPNASLRDTLRLPATHLGIVAFALYTGLEAAAGAWLYSLLTEARSLAPATAGTWTSVFWGGLAGGRVLSGIAAGSVRSEALLRGCTVCLLLGALLIAGAGAEMLALGGVALLGLAAGPVFPLLIAATPARVGALHSTNAVGFQIAAAALGQSMLPALIGILAARVGLRVVSPTLVAAALGLVLICEALRWVPVAALHGEPPRPSAEPSI
jgi:fucose permease